MNSQTCKHRLMLHILVLWVKLVDINDNNMPHVTISSFPPPHVTKPQKSKNVDVRFSGPGRYRCEAILTNTRFYTMGVGVSVFCILTKSSSAYSTLSSSPLMMMEAAGAVEVIISRSAYTKPSLSTCNHGNTLSWIRMHWNLSGIRKVVCFINPNFFHVLEHYFPKWQLY